MPRYIALHAARTLSFDPSSGHPAVPAFTGTLCQFGTPFRGVGSASSLGTSVRAPFLHQLPLV